MEKRFHIGILGGTGAVGEQMMELLEERAFPVKSLRLFASENSKGKEISFLGKTVVVESTETADFRGLDIMFGAAEDDIARKYADKIVAAGAVFVDNSSAFRLHAGVPLVVPEINPQDVAWHKGIIASPNCSTIIALVALYPIARQTKVLSIVASTYQAVSGAGVLGTRELSEQTKAVANGGEIVPQTFTHQIVENVIPRIGGITENGYTSEENKLRDEGRKILHLPDLQVSCTCVRVPVMRSHSVSVNFYTEEPVSVEQARAWITNGDGVKLADDEELDFFPMPLLTTNQDLVYVGRIREDETRSNGLALWCCGDQVRKGAATNTVQIAEIVAQML